MTTLCIFFRKWITSCFFLANFAHGADAGLAGVTDERAITRNVSIGVTADELGPIQAALTCTGKDQYTVSFPLVASEYGSCNMGDYLKLLDECLECFRFSGGFFPEKMELSLNFRSLELNSTSVAMLAMYLDGVKVTDYTHQPFLKESIVSIHLGENPDIHLAEQVEGETAKGWLDLIADFCPNVRIFLSEE